MAADALLAFKTSTKSKTAGGATTTTFGAGTTLADADAPLNITPQVQLRENGLFVKVMIQATGVTQASGTGFVQFTAALKASKTVNGTYTAVHQTPSDMVYLQAPTAATNTYSGKTNFTIYIPIAAPSGFTDAANTVQDLYTFFRVDVGDSYGGATSPSLGAYTYKVQIVSGKDGGIL
jgi:hypothetical protein